MIPSETLERVREAADLVQIVSEHVKLRRVGRGWRGACPIHGGKNPNFSVSPDKGLYHCFTCHDSGDVFTFLEKVTGCDFMTAVRTVAERVGIPIIEIDTGRRAGEERDPREPLWEVHAAARDFFIAALWKDDAASAARAYLESRALSREVADRFGLGYAPRNNALLEHLGELGYEESLMLEAGLASRKEGAQEAYSRFRDRLMIPIRDTRGHTVGFGGRLLADRENVAKYLNSAESPVFAKRRLLYHMDQSRNEIRKADRAIVVEGYFDVIRLVAAGVQGVVAGLGTALTEEQAALLAKYAKTVILLYDSDEAGLKATFRAGDELLRHGVAVRVATLPDGQDPDAFVQHAGVSALNGHLTDAVDVFDRKVQLLDRKGWFADLHKRRRAIDRLLPTIRAAADQVTRDLYVARAAEASGVEKSVLLREASGAGALSPRPRGEPQQSEPSDAPPDHSGYDESFESHAPGGGGSRRGRGDAWASSRASVQVHSIAEEVAERYLVRLMLHIPSLTTRVVERRAPDGFRHPTYRTLFQALLADGADSNIERLADRVNADALETAQQLLAEPIDELNRDETIEGCLQKLRVRDVVGRLREIDREQPLASGAEKDALLVEKTELQRGIKGQPRYKQSARPDS